MVKLVCISDLHGHLIDIPPCDILLLSGDITPTCDHSVSFQQQWLTYNFIDWRRRQPAKHFIYCAGNHDFYYEQAKYKSSRHEEMIADPTWMCYLQDDWIECCGLKIWGSPWQKPFFNWAFNMQEEDMVKKWAAMPDDIDIIISHGPPYGYGDYVPHTYTNNGTMLPQGEHTGSPSLLKRIDEVQPAVVCWGHIHSQYGQWTRGSTKLINASIVDESYRPVHKPIEVNL
jgi:Icc-related predicted phosphoesterase